MLVLFVAKDFLANVKKLTKAFETVFTTKIKKKLTEIFLILLRNVH